MHDHAQCNTRTCMYGELGAIYLILYCAYMRFLAWYEVTKDSSLSIIDVALPLIGLLF
jgi:hypothetical protein